MYKTGLFFLRLVDDIGKNFHSLIYFAKQFDMDKLYIYGIWEEKCFLYLTTLKKTPSSK